MMRIIVTPAVLPPAALAELKDWLGITTTADDASLSALLATALDVCADFLGLMPLACTVEELLPSATQQWQALATKPVISVLSAQGIAANNSRTAFTDSQFETRIEADGTGLIRISDPAGCVRVVLRLTAGLATDWATLPMPLRHGILRLAAHQYRSRDLGNGPGNADTLPPASVAALWRPWRHMRLA